MVGVVFQPTDLHDTAEVYRVTARTRCGPAGTVLSSREMTGGVVRQTVVGQLAAVTALQVGVDAAALRQRLTVTDRATSPAGKSHTTDTAVYQSYTYTSYVQFISYT